MRSLFLAACGLTASAISVQAQNLLANGSFEQPAVTERTTAGKGGSPALAGESSWASLMVDSGTEGGKLQAGITNEIARTGKQCLYVDFDKLTAGGRKAILKTKPIAVKSGQSYRLSIWGRVDRDRPLALDERRPQMWLEVKFLAEDQTTQTGEPIAGAQFLPGDIIPGGPHQLRFVTHKWKETSAELVTPAEAKFLTVTWYWLTSSPAEETDGVIYWDDAELVEFTPKPVEPAAPPASATTLDAAEAAASAEADTKTK